MFTFFVLACFGHVSFLLLGLNSCGVGGECVLRRYSVHGGCGCWRGWIAETWWGIVAFGWVRLRIFVFESASKRLLHSTVTVTNTFNDFSAVTFAPEFWAI